MGLRLFIVTLLAVQVLEGPAARLVASESRPSSALEVSMLADATDGRFDHHGLVHAALVASGIHDAPTARRLEQRVEDAARKFSRFEQTRATTVLGSPSRAATLLGWMHAEILSAEYRADHSSLAGPLEHGTFNCVSSAVLYHVLAQRAGLTTRIVQRPRHVLVEIVTPDGIWSVETTSATGMAQGEMPGKSGTHAVPSGQTGRRRVLSDVQVVALFYYNRATRYFHCRQYAEAIQASFVALRLDPGHRAARVNLLAAMNNWAVRLSEQRRFSEANRLFSASRVLAPDESILVLNHDLVRQAWRTQQTSGQSAGFRRP